MILSTSIDLYLVLPSSSTPSSTDSVFVPNLIGTGKKRQYLSSISCRRCLLKNSSDSLLINSVISVPLSAKLPSFISNSVLPAQTQCAGSAPSWYDKVWISTL